VRLPLRPGRPVAGPALVRDVFGGLAPPLAGLTPPTPLTVAHRAPDRLRG
jgi:hypothetical protein